MNIADPEVVTTDKIWQCKGRLLKSTGGNRKTEQLKDMCLSFALFRLLCRRFAGYSLSESSHEKTWKLVRNGLLFKEGDNERAFRVIEVELSFLYDFFYTKYPAIFRGRMLIFKIIQLITVVIVFWFTVSTLQNYRSPNGYLNLITITGHSVDVLVTGIMMMAIIFVDIMQAFLLIFSDWSKVMWICKYVQKESWQNRKWIEKMIEIVCHGSWLKPWEGKLGQYSLLESFDHSPFKLIYDYIVTYCTSRPGIKENAHIELPVEVKKAVADSIRINERRLTNGVASLERNGVADQLSWACRLETQAHVVMVWHIATSLCEFKSSEQVNPQSLGENFVVATSLSKYCAYLAVFAPRFLPDHAYTTELIIDKVLGEAKDVLIGCKNRTSIYEKLMALDKDNTEETIIKRGAKLGHVMIEGIEDEELRWKVLADFWAELMLFVASSNDIQVHADYLARGGEFVTHLWALLTHAGILTQDSTEQDV